MQAQTVATNIRFDLKEYSNIKKLAFLEKRSLASVVREATAYFLQKKLASSKTRKALLRSISKSAVTIDVPATRLVKEGRKFE